MAAKKENKAIGNLIIAVIPLIGIIWASVAGIQHRGYVKDVEKAEKAFEVKFADAINALQLSKDNNIVVEDLNITSVIPTFYQTKLRNDNVSNNSSSYTVKISANPTIKVNDKNEKYVEKFELNYEFFVTADAYSDFLTSYAQGKNVLVGYEDYLYLTYYKNNPRNSVIYALEPLFDRYHTNTLFYDYQDEVLCGLSSSLVVDMIGEIPETLTADKASLQAFNKLLNEIETQYKLLNEEQKAEVTNYNLFTEARKLYDAKSVQLQIEDIAECASSSDYKLSYSNALDDAVKAYNKLTEEQKSLVENYADLEEKQFYFPIYKAEYYVLQLMKEDGYTSSRVQNSVKFYNGLTAEQKAQYDAELFVKLQEFVTRYNSEVSEDKKLTIE